MIWFHTYKAFNYLLSVSCKKKLRELQIFTGVCCRQMSFITAAGDTDTYWARYSLVPVDWCFAVVSDCRSSTSVRSERSAPLLIQSQWSTPTTHKEVPVNVHVSTHALTRTHTHTNTATAIPAPLLRAALVCCIISNKELTLYLLTWRIWWAPNNASKGQMGLNSAFKGLNIVCSFSVFVKCVLHPHSLHFNL